MAITSNKSFCRLRFHELALLLALIAGGGCSKEKSAETASATKTESPPQVKIQAAPLKAGANSSAVLRKDQLSAALLAQFPEYDNCPRPDDLGTLRYAAQAVDLNNDSKAEVVAIAFGREACGSGGCTAFVLQDISFDYQVLTLITTASTPIKVANNQTAGWRDLIIEVSGGGTESGARLLQYNGKNYPENASLAPKAPKELQTITLIGEEDSDLTRTETLTPPACAQKSAPEPADAAIGGLTIGASANTVKKLLGQPKTVSKPELWAADGLYHQSWNYPNAGVVAGLSAPKPEGPWELFSVTLKPPAKLITERGIAIGAAQKDVLAAYGKEAQPGEFTGQQQSLIVGSEYQGLIFDFDKTGRVAQIFLGASAE